MTAAFTGHARAALLLGLASIATALHAAPFADFNNDGRSDIFWRNSVTGENYIYLMEGRTILPGEGYLRTVADQSWQVAGIGDFDGDGRADLLWRNAASGHNYVYFMSGAAILAEGYLRTVAERAWQVAGVGDFDGDSRSDILWRNSLTGENYIYFMDGTAIAARDGYLRTVADQSWQVAAIGDFDGDGKSDILWRNSQSGQNYVYLMDGVAIKAGEGYLRTVADLKWKVAAAGDFDGDGKADLLWRNAGTGENYVYLLEGTSIKPGEGFIRPVADLAWQVAGVGNFDADNKADILWRNSSTGENYLYPMDGTAILPGEGYLRTVAQTAWVAYGRLPVEFEALPVTLETAWAAAGVWTESQEIEFPPSCGSDPEINCMNGQAVSPLPRLALTRAAASVAHTATPMSYSFSSQVSLVSLSDIRMNAFGVTCFVHLDTAPGASPTVEISGTALFDALVPLGSVNRVQATSVQVSGLTVDDISVSGALLCASSGSFSSIFISTLQDLLAATIMDRRLCGAPGAPLFAPCPSNLEP